METLPGFPKTTNLFHHESHSRFLSVCGIYGTIGLRSTGQRVRKRLEPTEGIHWLAASQLNVGFLTRGKETKAESRNGTEQELGNVCLSRTVRSSRKGRSPSESYKARYESVADPHDHTPTIVS